VTGLPRPVSPAPPTLPRPLFRLFYVADLPSTQLGKHPRIIMHFLPGRFSRHIRGSDELKQRQRAAHADVLP